MILREENDSPQNFIYNCEIWNPENPNDYEVYNNLKNKIDSNNNT